MKSISKIKAALSGISVQKAIVKVSHYINELTGNVNFTLVPTPAEATVAVKALQQLEGQVVAGNHSYTPLRDEKMELVKSIVNGWVGQINLQAEGDVTKLESSGFEFVKGREPRPLPKQVSKLAAKNRASSGEVELFWGGSSDVKFYMPEFRCMDDVNPEWKPIQNCFKNRVVLTALGKAKEYEFRVRAVNTAGMGEYSSVASIVTQ